MLHECAILAGGWEAAQGTNGTTTIAPGPNVVHTMPNTLASLRRALGKHDYWATAASWSPKIPEGSGQRSHEGSNNWNPVPQSPWCWRRLKTRVASICPPLFHTHFAAIPKSKAPEKSLHQQSAIASASFLPAPLFQRMQQSCDCAEKNQHMQRTLVDSPPWRCRITPTSLARPLTEMPPETLTWCSLLGCSGV